MRMKRLIKLYVGFGRAGLITISTRRWSVHLFVVSPEFWRRWGYHGEFCEIVEEWNYWPFFVVYR